MSVKQILTWFQKAIPHPEKKNFNTQVGVHIEEFAEMLDTLRGDTPAAQERIAALSRLAEDVATDLKKGDLSISIEDPVEFVDAMCDQIVTSVGACHMAGIDVVGAISEVADSNDSKFDEAGEPILNPETRKIMKSERYKAPELAPFVTQVRFTTVA